MAIAQLVPKLLDSFEEFSKKYEYKSISLISRMYKKDRIVIPPASSAKIICEVTDSKPNCVLNVMMITAGGILLLMFSENPPSGMVIIEMLKLITGYKKNIFCILGVSKDTKTVKDLLDYSVSSKIEYILLRKYNSTIFKTGKAEFKIKKAKKKDALQLFPLEKEYLLEEVLVGSSELNPKATLLNLQKTCNTQSVFYALSGKEIIAKVNTNGKGIGYNQIGGVYTKPEFRNRGVSTYLMKILLDEIHQSGKKAVLYVKKDNKPALALYKKLGFHIIDEYSAYYVKP